jgi:hypothetical protein
MINFKIYLFFNEFHQFKLILQHTRKKINIQELQHIKEKSAGAVAPNNQNIDSSL